MSVWGRISQIIGQLGQSMSQVLDPDNWLPGGRDAAFTLALVALTAKMAVADGVVSASEERMFQSMIQVPDESRRDVHRFFELAQQDVAGYRSYARKVRKLFDDQPQTLEHVLDALFHIASADGMIHSGELTYLHDVGDIFGFEEVRFNQIAAQFMLPAGEPDPWMILGVSREADPAEVKRVYRRLVAEHHPDRLIAKGVPEELLDVATRRVAAINSAYDSIQKHQAA